MEPLRISLTSQITEFHHHLDEPRNERIIFSGQFGTGKTHFLREFFTSEKEYLAIRLSPVNYSVSSTEDIFRLVKYDILYELFFTYNLLPEVEKINWDVAYGMALQNKLPTVLSSLITMLPLLNKDLEPVTTLWPLVTSLVTGVQEIEANRQDANLNSRIVDFINTTDKLPLFEQDFISQFIELGLDKLAARPNEDDSTEVGTPKTKVLIIDDLDRIDPEHIFRLFNIFSAHLDYQKTTANKFDFDKVIFVCDIHNIRNIFHSRYGVDTDFTGYIDKFFSLEVYHFDNSAQIRAAVADFTQHIGATDGYREYFAEHILADRNGRPGNSMLSIVLAEFVYAGVLNMRRIEMVYGATYRLRETTSVLSNNDRTIQNTQIPALIILDILNWILGSAHALERALSRVVAQRKSKEYYEQTAYNQDWLVGQLLPILGYEKHGFQLQQYGSGQPPQAAPHTYTNEERKQHIGYDLIEYGPRRNLYYGKVEKVSNGVGIPENYRRQDLNFFDLLYHTFKLLRKLGQLK